MNKIHINFEAEKNDYPKDLSINFSKKLREVEKEIFQLGFYKVFLLDQTCCSICDNCVKSRLECKNPKFSRPSAESMAIDVYATVRHGFNP
ncbi:MAG: hypothetical protein JXR70_17925 [Spirochaetales bacterium]|nr:hypothetical protein [Spirochaetales bacterium]